jgi:outer membrane protein assembly factor BamB
MKPHAWYVAIALTTAVFSTSSEGRSSNPAPSGRAMEAVDTYWPQWRGPYGSGTSEERNLPTTWSAAENILWKTALPGRGLSSPIVWGERVFVTTALEGAVVPGAKAVKHMKGGQEFLHPDSCCGDRHHTFSLIALDRDTGRILWDLWERTLYEGTVYDNRHRKNSYAASTPVTDGRRVYAFFDAEGLYAVDFSGTVVWKNSLGKISRNGMGPGLSPILYGDLLILQCDSDEGLDSFIAAIHKDTGKEVWRTPRMDPRGHATPVLVPTADGMVLVASGEVSTVAYDPLTGRERWRGPGLEGNRAIPSAVWHDGIVVISAGYPGKLSLAFRAGSKGIAPPLWTYKKGGAYVPSPIVYRGLLYLMTDKGILTCLDPKTGEMKYEGGRVPVPATFTASAVAFDGKIFLTSEDGDTHVVEAGPVHRVLHTNSIGEPVFASLAMSQGTVFIRGQHHLYAIRQPPVKGS